MSLQSNLFYEEDQNAQIFKKYILLTENCLKKQNKTNKKHHIIKFMK